MTFGILWAWIVLSCITIPVFQILSRRRASPNGQGVTISDKTPERKESDSETAERS